MAPTGVPRRSLRRIRIAREPSMSYNLHMPATATGTREPSELVAAACRLIEVADEGVPTAAELAARLGVSIDVLRRAFTRVLGVTPRQYADTLRRERLRNELREGNGVSIALYSAGYGSTSRLYESAHDHLGMTPASYQAGGRGATIAYTVTDSPLGALLVAVTERGLCHIALGDTEAEVVAELHREFPAATVAREDRVLGDVVREVLARIDGRAPTTDLPLDMRGTAFQRRVWEELQRIPAGETRTYGEVATAIGAPGAARAVGRACATNPVPVVVPCHRVVPATGGIGNYGGGPARKRTLLQREGCELAATD
jgi:AraC family transcriptional regulator of adaptative response/methylated-DNA-[protein]-cysteine methyltransferase